MCRRPKEKYASIGRLVMFLCLIPGFGLRAQVYFSTRPDYVKVKSETNNLVSQYRAAYPDTNITGLHRFEPRNFMGNTGLPSPDYILSYRSGELGFRLFEPPALYDRFYEGQVSYCRSTGPYARLTGIAGSKQLQIFRMFFTHTYKDKVNVSLAFNRYTSQGFYRKQQTYTNNFYLTSNYTTPNKRAGYYVYILNNGNKNQENGGIRDNSLTDVTVLQGKELLNLKLSAANRDNREFKAMINPWVRLHAYDTIHAGHYLQVKSQVADNSFRYKDVGIKADKFYQRRYLVDTVTLDSSHVRRFTNELNYSVLWPGGRFAASAGYRNEINQVWQQGDSLVLNQLATGDIVFRKRFKEKDSAAPANRSYEAHANVQYVFAGGNAGNYKVESNQVYFFNAKRTQKLSLDAFYESRSPDFQYNRWISNHFVWLKNGYRPVHQWQARAGISAGHGLSFSVLYQDIYNYLYFDREALPRQLKTSVRNVSASLEYSRIFFKHLGVSVHYLFQNTSHPGYVRIPPAVYTGNLFYHGNLFRNNLQLQLGTQVQVYGEFSGYAYMPSTQAFYLQDGFKSGSYPYVDVYLNARIRPVSFFLKLENSLHGLVGNNYAFVPGYYQPDRAFRFGLSWMFFD